MCEKRDRNPWLRIVKDKIKERGGIAVTSSSVQESPSAPRSCASLLATPWWFLLLVQLGFTACQLVAPECLNSRITVSQFWMSLKSVAFRTFCFMLHGFTWKKGPWNMETVVNWHSPFPFLVSCLLSLRWNLSMFFSREHRWGPMDQAFEAVGSEHLVHSSGPLLRVPAISEHTSADLCFKTLMLQETKQFFSPLEAIWTYLRGPGALEISSVL